VVERKDLLGFALFLLEVLTLEMAVAMGDMLLLEAVVVQVDILALVDMGEITVHLMEQMALEGVAEAVLEV
jgi:hypothetical protein